MKHFYGIALLALVSATFLFPTRSAAEQPNDPMATRIALIALIASSNAVIPRASTCSGNYGQSGKPTIKDLLAMELAYLYSGENAVEGGCIDGSCTVTIRHAAGEDVSSATIEFRIKKGKADPATLHCVITP